MTNRQREVGRQWHIIGNHNIYVRLTTTQAKSSKQIIDSCHSAPAAAQPAAQPAEQSAEHSAAGSCSQTLTNNCGGLQHTFFFLSHFYLCFYVRLYPAFLGILRLRSVMLK